jgi:hypothetical protein
LLFCCFQFGFAFESLKELEGASYMGANDINRRKVAHVEVVEMLRGLKKIHIVRRWE